MGIKIDYSGFDELQKAVEKAADQAELQRLNKKILTECADITKDRMKGRMPKSANNAKSGKRGNRPSGHAADNIPVKVTGEYAEVGWKLTGDAANWFYMKFVEWGTSKMPPRDFLENTAREAEAEHIQIADREYQAFLDERLGG